VNVTLNTPSQAAQTYNYHLAHHRALTPQVLAAMVATTVEAKRMLPVENSTRVTATMRLEGESGEHTLRLDTTQANANGASIATELLPIILSMMNNTFDDLKLKSMDMRIDSRAGRRDAGIFRARIERTLVEPGDTVDAIIELKVAGKPVVPVRIEFKVPDDLKEGDYRLIICDPKRAMQYQLQTQPQLRRVHDIDEMVAMTQKILDTPSNALFALLQKQKPHLAIGRSELPDLPSSMQTILNARTSTSVTAYQEWIINRKNLDLTPTGEIQFTLNVRRPDGDNGAENKGAAGKK
jgi:hypothetical protein